MMLRRAKSLFLPRLGNAKVDTPSFSYPNFENVVCDYCHRNDYETISIIDGDYEMFGLVEDKYALRTFRIVQCNHCSLIYLNPRPEKREIYHYYPDNYPCFDQFPPKSKAMRLLYKRMVLGKKKLLFPYLPENGVLLDFGCGNGHWLIGLKEHASPHQRLVGIDPCESPIRELKTKGVEAYVGDESILESLFPPNSVDVIILNHLIEHVPDPLSLLTTLEKLLTPSGIIYGITPNEAAWDRRFFGEIWSGWHAPRHFLLFNHQILKNYAERANLKVVYSGSEMEGASHWAVSFHTWLIRHGMKLKRGQFRLKIYPALLIFSIVITIVQKIFSQTSIMSFVLSKRAD